VHPGVAKAAASRQAVDATTTAIPVDARPWSGKIVGVGSIRSFGIPEPRMVRIENGWANGRAIAITAFCAIFLAAPAREDIAYLTPDRTTVSGGPDRATAPALAVVLGGCAVRVLERKEGMARISIEGWLPEEALAKTPPWQPAPKETPATPPPPPELPTEPVNDLALAHHVGVRADSKGETGAAKFVVTLDLRTFRNRPVVVAGSKLTGHVTVYVQRRMAGGRARGDALFDRAVTFEDGKATLELTPAELVIPERVRQLLISARAELPGERTIHGAAVDVAVAAR
jgi:hypothetical protein